MDGTGLDLGSGDHLGMGLINGGHQLEKSKPILEHRFLKKTYFHSCRLKSVVADAPKF